MMNAKVKQALEDIVQRFKEGDVPRSNCLFDVSDPQYPGFKMVIAQPDTHVPHRNR